MGWVGLFLSMGLTYNNLLMSELHGIQTQITTLTRPVNLDSLLAAMLEYDSPDQYVVIV